MKHLLIISNNCLSKNDSNGRTMLNLLKNFSKDSLAQFYIHGNPDFDVCDNYYCVSDREALNSLLNIRHKKPNGKVELNVSVDTNRYDKKYENKIKRNCRNLVIRDWVWSTYRWWTKEFDLFLKKFSPDAVLLQAGDAPFMFKIALKISKKYSVPLYMYNSENYVLKKVMFSSASKYSPWHMLLKSSLKFQYKRLMQRVSYCFYSTEYLEECYQKVYPHVGKSAFLYTSTDMNNCRNDDNENDNFTMLYCGNLGVGRLPVICEMADVLLNVDPKAILSIYGNILSDSDRKELCSHKNVVYNGVIPYSDIPNKIAKASMVIHCENPERLENLKTAFSTKIADSLACGKPFLVYASREYPFVKYLEKNNAAHIAENKNELFSTLKRCISDIEFRYSHVKNSLELSQKNHNLKKNAEKLYWIIHS